MNEIKIASLACSGEGGLSAALERAGTMITEACYDQPDLICLPELFAWTGMDTEHKIQAAEPIGGRVSGAMAKIAEQYGLNVLAPVLERENDRIYNSMVWFNRKGNAIGIYRKVFPTDYEMAAGISPGPLDFNVFDTEFGPVGCCICFDLNFREVIEHLVAQKTRLVIVPTMFQGLTLMQAWAKLYRMYFISVSGYPYAAVVSPLGVPIIPPWVHDSIMRTTLSLDYVVLHTDYNMEKFAVVKKTYGAMVEITCLDIESSALLTSRHPEKTAEEITNECDLEPEERYYQRSAEIRQRKLKNIGELGQI